MEDKWLYRVAEAAELASIGRTKAYELINSGMWPIVRIGTAVRVDASGLREWIKAQRTGGATDVDDMQKKADRG